MERKLATIRKVEEIRPIEGADLIELAIVGGWQCVIRKGEFNPGELGVYFEIDSFLPIEPRFEFLRKSSFKKIQAPLQGQREEGFKLKTVKLRGQISQGLILPLSSFPELAVDAREGLDVTALLNVEKYEPPVPATLSGQVRGMRPTFIKKTDEERIQNLVEYFDLYKDLSFECTEKMDGSSMTVYRYESSGKTDFGVCSRNLNLLEDDVNTMWKEARRLDLEKLLTELNRNIALQGEIVGESIQKNPLKIKGQHMYLFNIWDIEKRRHLTPDERMEIFHFLEERTPIKHVPVVSPRIKIFKECETVNDLLEFASAKSLVNPGVFREGVIFKSNEVVGAEILSFKAISNKYLLKHGN